MEDKYFIFAGKIYERPVRTGYWRLQPVVAIISSLLILVFASLLQNKQHLLGRLLFLANRFKVIKGERKIYNTGSNQAIMRFAVGDPIPSEDEPSLITPSSSLSQQLRQLGSALSLSQKQKVETEKELDVLRQRLFQYKSRKAFLSELNVYETTSQHPLGWIGQFSDDEDDDIINKKAKIAIPLGSHLSKCKFCSKEMEDVQQLSKDRFASLLDLSRRRRIESSLEQLVWYAMRTKEPLFNNNDCLRVIEPTKGYWNSEITGWYKQVLFSTAFSNPVNIPMNSHSDSESICKLVESCCSNLEKNVSCAIVQPIKRRLFGRYGVRFARYDVIIDIIEQKVYFHHSIPFIYRKMVLQTLNFASSSSTHQLKEEKNKMAQLLSTFETAWVLSVPAAVYEKEIPWITYRLRYSLNLSSAFKIGMVKGTLNEPQVVKILGEDEIVVWISPFSLNEKLTVLVFSASQNKALCGCAFLDAFEEMCSYNRDDD